MGFALWIDRPGGLAWARGTHEYRPMGTAVIAITDQFRARDFRPRARCHRNCARQFAGFFGSIEEVNVGLKRPLRTRPTPAHLL